MRTVKMGRDFSPCPGGARLRRWPEGRTGRIGAAADALVFRVRDYLRVI